MAIDGTWEVSMDTPMGEQKATVELTTNGGVLNGKIVKSALGGEADFEGKVDGNKIEFSVDISNPMPMTLVFNVEVDGDDMSGDVALGAFGKAALKGQRSA